MREEAERKEKNKTDKSKVGNKGKVHTNVLNEDKAL